MVGLTFWVQADDLAAAATTALATARTAGEAAEIGPGYYDVTLVPRDAIVVPWEDHTVRMPD